MALYPPWSCKQELCPVRAGCQPLRLVLRGETELSSLAMTPGSGGHRQTPRGRRDRPGVGGAPRKPGSPWTASCSLASVPAPQGRESVAAALMAAPGLAAAGPSGRYSRDLSTATSRLWTGAVESAWGQTAPAGALGSRPPQGRGSLQSCGRALPLLRPPSAGSLSPGDLSLRTPPRAPVCPTGPEPGPTSHLALPGPSEQLCPLGPPGHSLSAKA